MTITFMPKDETGHTATPAAESYTVEGSGAPARLTRDEDYPVIAICKVCQGRIRLGSMTQMEWRHAPVKPWTGGVS